MLYTRITPDHSYFFKVNSKSWGVFYYNTEEEAKCYHPSLVWLCDAKPQTEEVLSGVYLTDKQVRGIGVDYFAACEQYSHLCEHE